MVLGWFWLCPLVDLRAVLRKQLSDFCLGPCEADKCRMSLCQLNCPSNVAVTGSVLKTSRGLNHVLPRDLFSCEDRGESFHNETSLSALQHHKVPSDLNDERQSEAPASGNKQSAAL